MKQVIVALILVAVAVLAYLGITLQSAHKRLPFSTEAPEASSHTP